MWRLILVWLGLGLSLWGTAHAQETAFDDRIDCGRPLRFVPPGQTHTLHPSPNTSLRLPRHTTIWAGELDITFWVQTYLVSETEQGSRALDSSGRAFNYVTDSPAGSWETLHVYATTNPQIDAAYAEIAQATRFGAGRLKSEKPLRRHNSAPGTKVMVKGKELGTSIQFSRSPTATTHWQFYCNIQIFHE